MSFLTCGNPEKCSKYFTFNTSVPAEKIRTHKIWQFELVLGYNVLLPDWFFLERTYYICWRSLGGLISFKNSSFHSDYKFNENSQLERLDGLFSVALKLHSLYNLFVTSYSKTYFRVGSYNLTATTLDGELSVQKMVQVDNGIKCKLYFCLCFKTIL